MDYYKNRDERCRHAAEWTHAMREKYSDKIRECSDKTRLYDSVTLPFNKRFDTTPMIVEEADTVTALMRHSEDVALLNFASFTNPGGKFFDGSSAQEESLCHESFLYNVLVEKQDYYVGNQADTNKGMYRNRALYSPDVIFERNGTCVAADVLTCACPNRRNVLNGRATEEYNLEMLESRIDFLLNIFAYEGKTTIILGAFGCGVFKQNPLRVAEIFKKLLKTKYEGVFKLVVFAVPDATSENYNAFRSTIAPVTGSKKK